MKMKKLFLFGLPVALLLGLCIAVSSFTTTERSLKVNCQFSPVTSDFVNVEFENCNNLKTNALVAAGNPWNVSLLTAGCQVVYIATNLPASHPAGTINIYKNGVLQASHPVAQNQSASFSDQFAAAANDNFLVTW